ncbi:hypothetical protein J5X84_09910 [Streptosporangiaceae bacterium NEAU-GS5]|nr:hypothetical protein [Streptosporangiaceae bacterium NEAU-GS5]
MMRMVVPSRIRRAARARLDARYASRADHRDALFELKMLRREVVALRREVDRLREGAARSQGGASQAGSSAAQSSSQASSKASPASSQPGAKATSKGGVVVSPAQVARGEEAYRLAIETAESLDQVLQNEVRLWQAIDALRSTLRQGQYTDASR